jgi:hypothetical protein
MSLNSDIVLNVLKGIGKWGTWCISLSKQSTAKARATEREMVRDLRVEVTEEAF